MKWLVDGRHAALVNFDACRFRSHEDLREHKTLNNDGWNGCLHSHTAWGGPCAGCCSPNLTTLFPPRHKKWDE